MDKGDPGKVGAGKTANSCRPTCRSPDRRCEVGMAACRQFASCAKALAVAGQFRQSARCGNDADGRHTGMTVREVQSM